MQFEVERLPEKFFISKVDQLSNWQFGFFLLTLLHNNTAHHWWAVLLYYR
jgi:hypothetical protein